MWLPFNIIHFMIDNLAACKIRGKVNKIMSIFVLHYFNLFTLTINESVNQINNLKLSRIDKL